jgi:hypothetical protein
MATFLGNEGVVKIGSSQVLEVKSFSFNQSAATTEATAMGDSWTTHIVTQKSWQGTMTCHWDGTDKAGQGAMGVGNTVNLTLYPQGLTGEIECTGAVIITGVETQQSQEGLVEATFTFQGTGALTLNPIT